MRYYCTHFDINYAAHALNLHTSLLEHERGFTLFMFCMCSQSYEYLHSLALRNVTLVKSADLESFLPELESAKSNRSKVEYFYTCSPCTCYYVLNKYPQIDMVTYLDADLFFFNSPDPLFDELGENSIGIIEHRFNYFTKRNLVYGRFNVGWINFRNDVEGLTCLRNWKDDCLDWCYQRLDGDKYADQKYLDKWPEKFKKIKILQHKGANVAVWNIRNYSVKVENSNIYIGDEKLIFYHFANLKQLEKKLFKTDLSRVFVRTTDVIKYNIYMPYIEGLLINGAISKKIFAKKDEHISGIYSHFVKFTRIVRDKIFPDLIKM